MKTERLTRRRHHDRPDAGTWRVDPALAEVTLVVKQYLPYNLFGPGTQDLRGRIRGVTGAICVDEGSAAGEVDLTLDVATFTTGNVQVDRVMRSSAALDVERYPTASFTGTMIRTREGGWLRGCWNFRGTAHHVTVGSGRFRFAHDPDRPGRGVFSALGEVDRAPWGFTARPGHPLGHLLLGRDLRLGIVAPAEIDP